MSQDYHRAIGVEDLDASLLGALRRLVEGGGILPEADRDGPPAYGVDFEVTFLASRAAPWDELFVVQPDRRVPPPIVDAPAPTSFSGFCDSCNGLRAHRLGCPLLRTS